MNANRWPILASRSWRDEGNDRPIIAVTNLRHIAAKKFGYRCGYLLRDAVCAEANDLERMSQPVQMFPEPKNLTAKCAQALGDRRTQQKTGIVNRDRKVRVWNPRAVQIRRDFAHAFSIDAA